MSYLSELLTAVPDASSFFDSPAKKGAIAGALVGYWSVVALFCTYQLDKVLDDMGSTTNLDSVVVIEVLIANIAAVTASGVGALVSYGFASCKGKLFNTPAPQVNDEEAQMQELDTIITPQHPAA